MIKMIAICVCYLHNYGWFQESLFNNYDQFSEIVLNKNLGTVFFKNGFNRLKSKACQPFSFSKLFFFSVKWSKYRSIFNKLFRSGILIWQSIKNQPDSEKRVHILAQYMQDIRTSYDI